MNDDEPTWVNAFTYEDSDNPDFIDAGKDIQIDTGPGNFINLAVANGSRGRATSPFGHAAWQTLYPKDIDNLITALQYAKSVLEAKLKE